MSYPRNYSFLYAFPHYPVACHNGLYVSASKLLYRKRKYEKREHKGRELWGVLCFKTNASLQPLSVLWGLKRASHRVLRPWCKVVEYCRVLEVISASSLRRGLRPLHGELFRLIVKEISDHPSDWSLLVDVETPRVRPEVSNNTARDSGCRAQVVLNQFLGQHAVWHITLKE